MKSKARIKNWIYSFFFALPFLMIVHKIWTSDFTNQELPKLYLDTLGYSKGIWPWFSGWNPNGFGGHPQGYFEPKLLPWLAGGLAKLVDVPKALHFFMTISTLLFPFSIWLFLKDLGYKKQQVLNSIILIFLCSYFLGVEPNLQGSFREVFNTGDWSTFFAMPFVFFYLWAFNRGVRSNEYMILAGIFLSVAFLSDQHTTIVIALLSVGYALLHYHFGSYHRYGLAYAGHVIVVLGLTALWVGPRLLFWNEGGHEYIFHPGLLRVMRLAAPLTIMVAFSLAHILRKNSEETIKEIRTPLYFFGFCFVSFVAISFFKRYFFVFLESPAYLTFYIYAFGASLVGYLGYEKTWLKNFLCTLFLVATIYGLKAYFPFQSTSLRFMEVPTPRVRGIIVEDVLTAFFGKYQMPHTTSEILSERKADVLDGLDVEESKVAPFVYGYQEELAPHRAYKGYSFSEMTNPNHIFAHANALGAQWVLRSNFMHDETFMDILPKNPGHVIVAQLMANGQKRDVTYSFQLDPQITLAAYFQKPPLTISKNNWDRDLKRWWTSDDLSQIPVESDQELGDSDGPLPKAQPIYFMSPESLNIDLILRNGLDRWVYVKNAYFPDFQATEQGKPVTLYRAGPNMMALKGQGHVQIKFVRSAFEKLCHYISFGSWFFAGGYFLYVILVVPERRSYSLKNRGMGRGARKKKNKVAA